MNLSNKQKQLLEEIAIIAEDHKEIDEEYYREVAAENIPLILSPIYKEVTLNYEDYLGSCKVKKATIIQHTFNVETFHEPFEEISNNEVLLYRSYLEDILQKGLHALMEIQFLDTLVILKRETSAEKLPFSSDLKNIKFLMSNLVKFLDLNHPTVANEIFEKEKEKVANDLNMELRNRSPEDVENIMENVKLNALSIALAKQHRCLIDNTARIKSNFSF